MLYRVGSGTEHLQITYQDNIFSWYEKPKLGTIKKLGKLYQNRTEVTDYFHSVLFRRSNMLFHVTYQSDGRAYRPSSTANPAKNGYAREEPSYYGAHEKDAKK